MDFKTISDDIKQIDTHHTIIKNDGIIRSILKDDELLSYIKQFGINNRSTLIDNLGTIISLKEDLDYCRKCPGFYQCNKPHQHYTFALKKGGKYLDKILLPCNLKEKDEKLNQLYIIRDFPDAWKELSVYELDKSKNRQTLFKRYQEAVKDKKNWVYISGNHRSGKSYIAATLLNDLIKTYGGKGAYLNFPERVKDLQSYTYNNKDDFNKYMEIYSTINYLVLDDFGNEYKSDYVRDSITLTILNERARKGLITIFTSEFNFDDIANMYTLNLAGKARAKQLKNLLTTYAINEIDISTVNIY